MDDAIDAIRLEHAVDETMARVVAKYGPEGPPPELVDEVARDAAVRVVVVHRVDHMLGQLDAIEDRLHRARAAEAELVRARQLRAEEMRRRALAKSARKAGGRAFNRKTRRHA